MFVSMDDFHHFGWSELAPLGPRRDGSRPLRRKCWKLSSEPRIQLTELISFGRRNLLNNMESKNASWTFKISIVFMIPHFFGKIGPHFHVILKSSFRVSGFSFVRSWNPTRPKRWTWNSPRATSPSSPPSVRMPVLLVWSQMLAHGFFLAFFDLRIEFFVELIGGIFASQNAAKWDWSKVVGPLDRIFVVGSQVVASRPVTGATDQSGGLVGCIKPRSSTEDCRGASLLAEKKVLAAPLIRKPRVEHRQDMAEILMSWQIRWS